MLPWRSAGAKLGLPDVCSGLDSFWGQMERSLSNHRCRPKRIWTTFAPRYAESDRNNRMFCFSPLTPCRRKVLVSTRKRKRYVGTELQYRSSGRWPNLLLVSPKGASQPPSVRVDCASDEKTNHYRSTRGGRCHWRPLRYLWPHARTGERKTTSKGINRINLSTPL